ncbi:MAG: hypothetical protein R2691_06440 [Solirubrobacterales bacterium]
MLPDVAGELVAEMAVEEVVEVLAAELLVAAGPADDRERVPAPLQDRGVEGAATEVVDGDVLALAETLAREVDGRGDRLRDEGRLAEAGHRRCLAQLREPRPLPARRMGEADLGRRLAAAQRYRLVVDLAEDRGDDLDRPELLVAELDELLAEPALRGPLEAPRGQRRQLLGLDAEHEPSGSRCSGALTPEGERWHPRPALKLDRLDPVADPPRRRGRCRTDVDGEDPAAHDHSRRVGRAAGPLARFR